MGELTRSTQTSAAYRIKLTFVIAFARRVSRPRERFMQQITTQNIVGKSIDDDGAAIRDCGSTAACAVVVLEAA